MREVYTYFELSMETPYHYYAVIKTRDGWVYYEGKFKSRSAAYRYSKKHPFNQWRIK